MEIDGISTTNDVVVMAATNRPDILDPALLRPGRFDRHIYISPPAFEDRKQIFELLSSKTKFDSAITADKFAEISDRFTGAEIVSIVQDAAFLALDSDASLVIILAHRRLTKQP